MQALTGLLQSIYEPGKDNYRHQRENSSKPKAMKKKFFFDQPSTTQT